MRVKCELEQVVQLKTKGKVVFNFDKQHAGMFTNFTDKPLTIEILVDEPSQRERLAQISGDQRRKVYALVKDIANFLGDSVEATKDNLKGLFCHETQLESFSLSDCDKDTASEFIEWLIGWAFEQGAELSDKPMEYFDDTERYNSVCIAKKICAVCGQAGEIHHIDAIGMGRNRNTYDDSSHRKVCLCRVHHSEAHTSGWDTFNAKYHIEDGVVA